MGDGGTCIDCTSTTSSYFLCKLQGRDGNPERHPFCFDDTGSLQILYSLSEPNWCVLFGICATNYRREDVGSLLIPPLGTQIFIYASCTCICGIWGTTTMIRPSTLLVGIRWEYKDIYSFGDANAYDLYKPIWILPKIQAGFEGGRGRLFVATAGVD